MARCAGLNAKGDPCTKDAPDNERFCRMHSGWPSLATDNIKFPHYTVGLACGHEATFVDAAPPVGGRAYCYRCGDFRRVKPS